PIGHGEVDKREQTRRFPRVEALRLRNYAGNSAPPGRRGFKPETGDGSLFGGSGRAVLFADGLHLVVLSCVSLSCLARWPSRRELVAPSQHEWGDLSPAGKYGG